jgi:hypothetical protein
MKEQNYFDDKFPHVFYLALSYLPLIGLAINVCYLFYIFIAPNLYIYERLLSKI